jgi:hypothetical protein
MSLRVWVAALALPFMLGACEEPKETGTKVQANVTLPDPPKMPTLPVPAQYENNIYSISGIKRAMLLRRGPKILDTDQVIRGFVLEHYQNPCPPKSKDCFGKKPHFFIADSIDSKNRMTIVPDWEIEGKKLEEMFKVGESKDFKGKFSQNAINGFTDAAGLLNIEDPNAEPIPPGGLDPTGAPPVRKPPQ